MLYKSFVQTMHRLLDIIIVPFSSYTGLNTDAS